MKKKIQESIFDTDKTEIMLRLIERDLKQDNQNRKKVKKAFLNAITLAKEYAKKPLTIKSEKNLIHQNDNDESNDHFTIQSWEVISNTLQRSRKYL